MFLILKSISSTCYIGTLIRHWLHAVRVHERLTAPPIMQGRIQDFSPGVGWGRGGEERSSFFYKGLHSELKLSSSYKFDTISDYNCFKTEIRKLEGRIEASQIERGEEKDHMQCS